VFISGGTPTHRPRQKTSLRAPVKSLRAYRRGGCALKGEWSLPKVNLPRSRVARTSSARLCAERAVPQALPRSICRAPVSILYYYKSLTRHGVTNCRGMRQADQIIESYAAGTDRRQKYRTKMDRRGHLFECATLAPSHPPSAQRSAGHFTKSLETGSTKKERAHR
jgi:hypothetical protein